MNSEAHQKVTAGHLRRNAYLYVRQSTVRQVLENTESTQRQYALRQRATALGWPAERVIVIDTDLGQSGASAVDREGFQQLVADVGLGRAGIVLGLEVSRLARNSTDWHRLLEICALTDTLILDEDGVYDPAHFNDRLLLGLKGTMSEAELHVLRARLRGGMLNKARRGELRFHLPIGYVHDAVGRVVLDPDLQVQESIHTLFRTYARTGAAHATVKFFTDQRLLFPARLDAKPRKGELVWAPLSLNRAVNLLHNPWYAGVYAYGRYRWRKRPNGGMKRERLPRAEWHAFIKDAHPAYISWEEHERIEQTLEAFGKGGFGRDGGPPREGSALLQGRVLCGICGRRMQVAYHSQRTTTRRPTYVCASKGRPFAEPMCQSISGAEIDAAVGKLLVETMTPRALELALAVQDEIQVRLDEADRLRHRQVERAQYEADRSRHRYMQVDPANRLVADTLEADWNERLRDLAAAREEYERQRTADRSAIDEEQRARIRCLAADFPAIWSDPRTPQRERKRMFALLVEDVTLLKQRELTAQVRFRGGATATLTVPRPQTASELRTTSREAREQINALLEEYTDAQVAHALNNQGLRTGAGEPFDATSVQWVRHAAKLPSLRDRLIAAGMLTGHQIAAKLGVARSTINRMRVNGSLKARICTNKGEWLYWPPDNIATDLNATAQTAPGTDMDRSPARGAV